MKQIALIAVAALAACTGKPSFNDASLSDVQFDLESFFDGDFIAYGQF
jgi:hypothetical protein